MREPGLYYDIPNEEYHSWRWAIGSSGLKAMRRGPAYYYGQYLDPNCPAKEEKDSPGRLFGSMTHCALFEPHELATRYPVGMLPAGFKAPKQSKAWKEQAEAAEARGCTLVDSVQYGTAIAARDACLRVPGIARWFDWEKARGEATIIAIDPVTGVRCKIRCDLLHFVNDREVVILDGKSYASVDPGEFGRQVARMDYDLQTAFYFDVATWAGFTVLAHMYLGYESEYPHQPRLFELDREGLENGRRKARRALNSYAECIKFGIWPGPEDSIATISLPPYAMEYDQ